MTKSWYQIYDWLPESWKPWLKVLDAARWITNGWVIGLPYAIFVAISMVYNILTNVDWNHYWAGGNFFLLANTVYLVMQGVFSTFLMFEVNIILQKMKTLRAISFMSAIVYNTLYFAGIADWIYELYWSDKAALDYEFGFFDVMLQLFIAYNAIFHFPIVPMNCAIILKEVQLEFFHLLGNVFAPSKEERLQLGLLDFGTGLEQVLNLINPFWWIQEIGDYVFHWNFSKSVGRRLYF